MGVGEERQTVFSALVKRSYDIAEGQPLVPREEVTPFRGRDAYYQPGDPETCSVRNEDEMAPYKLATDIVVIAEAHAAGGQPTQTMMVGVEVDGNRKLLRITGDRTASFRAGAAPVFSDPEPFATMPIRYERAYGGRDERSRPDKPFHYPRNPLGRGVAILNTQASIEGLGLPNIEDPQDLLTPETLVLEDESAWNRKPLPQGFGWFQKNWYPRCSFVGAVPGYVPANEVMREELLGLVPRGQIRLARAFQLPSFDVRFNNGSSLGLAVTDARPGTRIRLAGLTEDGMLSFTLPGGWPQIVLDIGIGKNTLETVLHTVEIDVAQRQATMIWRGAHPYPGTEWLPEMRRLDVEVH
jgi:hypothetical protein